MPYLLDTNACIALINGTPPKVRNQFDNANASGESLSISSIVTFELWYGVAKGSRTEFNSMRLRDFLGGPVKPLEFNDDDARIAGEIRARLEIAGKPIGAYDVLIAGQAVNRRLTLVTANHEEFARIPDLSWENWAKP